MGAARQASLAVLELGRRLPGTVLESFILTMMGGAPRPELLCIAPADDIETRLQAQRAGAQSLYMASVPAADLAKKVI